MLKNKLLVFSSFLTAGLLSNSSSSNALGVADINKLAENIIVSISTTPNLIAALGYLGGLFFGVIGIIKLKDHVENPSSISLASVAIRLFIGGCMLSLPSFYDVMINTTAGGGLADTSGPTIATGDFKE